MDGDRSVTSEILVEQATAALGAGRWAEARECFDAALRAEETAEACLGLSTALWWLGENRAAVDCCTRGYARFRRASDLSGAVRSALWLGVMYKANFANQAAANGWIGRAERLATGEGDESLLAWVRMTRAYQMSDLPAARRLTERALERARTDGDVDLELLALSQLGRIRVGQGDTEAGLALVDEAMAAALGGESTSLDTVVYICCDMLNACDLATDLDRAVQWCGVAEDFIARYGCPFLYAECRTLYGSVLAAKGRWGEAEQELGAALRLTADGCPGLHLRARARLADLRVRQGRVDEADQLLADVPGGADGLQADLEADLEATLARAALLLSRGEAASVLRLLGAGLERLTRHRRSGAAALALVVEAHLAADDLDGAAAAVGRLRRLAGANPDDAVAASAAGAAGRLARARGDREAAVAALTSALAGWTRLGLPYEAGRDRFELATTLGDGRSGSPEAVDLAQRALADLAALGAGADADRVAAWLRAHGVATRAGPREGGLLTRREEEVLGLLGLGLSNPEIAGRLHLSPKTASHHVSRILSKLGLRNRAEAAAYVTRTTGAAAGAAGAARAAGTARLIGR